MSRFDKSTCYMVSLHHIYQIPRDFSVYPKTARSREVSTFPRYKFVDNSTINQAAMHNDLEQALAPLIKAVAFYIFVLAFRELLRVLEPFIDLSTLQAWSQRNRRDFGPPPRQSSPS
jgi:hypothetical protein